jgi:hypothetical protein
MRLNKCLPVQAMHGRSACGGIPLRIHSCLGEPCCNGSVVQRGLLPSPASAPRCPFPFVLLVRPQLCSLSTHTPHDCSLPIRIASTSACARLGRAPVSHGWSLRVWSFLSEAYHSRWVLQHDPLVGATYHPLKTIVLVSTVIAIGGSVARLVIRAFTK